jgi:hypothetical protein
MALESLVRESGVDGHIATFEDFVRDTLARIAVESADDLRRGLRPWPDNQAGECIDAWETPLTRKLEFELKHAYEVGDKRYPQYSTPQIAAIKGEFPRAKRGENWNDCDLSLNFESNTGSVWIECKAVFEKVIPRDRSKSPSNQRDWTGATATHKGAQTRKSIEEIMIDARKLECLCHPDAEILGLLILGFDTIGNFIGETAAFSQLSFWLDSRGWKRGQQYHWDDACSVRSTRFREHLWFWWKPAA